MLILIERFENRTARYLCPFCNRMLVSKYSTQPRKSCGCVHTNRKNEVSPTGKFTGKIARQIRKERRNGAKLKELAIKYETSIMYIYYIVTNRRWKEDNPRITKVHTKSTDWKDYNRLHMRWIWMKNNGGVCEEWEDFKQFKYWYEHSSIKKNEIICKKDMNKPYSPDNYEVKDRISTMRKKKDGNN